MSHALHIRTPTKVILFGEHAVTAGHAGVVATIDKYIDFHVTTVTTHDDSIDVTWHAKDTKVDAGEVVKLFNVILADFKQHVDNFDELKYCGWHISIKVNARLASGLGSSSCFIVGLVKLCHTMLDLSDTHEPVLATASRIEKSLDPLVSGIDMAAIYHGGSHQYTTSQGCIGLALPLSSFYLIDTNQRHDTTQSLRALQSIHNVGDLYASMGALVTQLTDSLKARNITLPDMEALMCKNNTLLRSLGVSCDAADVIQSIVPNSKITGSGNGGYMIALSLTEAQKRQLSEHNFDVEHVSITHAGIETVSDNRYHDVPELLLHLQKKVIVHWQQHQDHLENATGFGTAPSNIALIKYWGKLYKQLPANPSISYTIGGFRSFTRSRIVNTVLDANASSTTTPSDASNASLGGCSRSQQFLDKMVPLGGDFQIKIDSFNNFPSSCGIASSASGFCAMVMAVNDLLNVAACLSTTEYKYWTDTWCRLGSGSSIRSSKPGFNTWEWTASNYVASPLESSMHHLVVIMNQQEKEISSAEGHKTVDSSLFQTVRRPNAVSRFPIIVKALQQGDFQTLKLLTEEDAMFMHCVMNTSDPQCNYLSPDTVAFVNFFIQYTLQHNIDAFYTIDAGPNVHILSKSKHDHDQIVGMLETYTSMMSPVQNLIGWIENKCTEGATQGLDHYDRLSKQNQDKGLNVVTMAKTIFVVRGKRYCGKTTFANKLYQYLRQTEKVTEVAISYCIKQQYAELHQLDLDRLLYDSQYKEQYRQDMIHYRNTACLDAKKPHYWAERACASLHSKYVIVQDVRYRADLAYIRTLGKVVMIEVGCNDALRKTRGWSPGPVDVLPSEMDLDEVEPVLSIVDDQTNFDDSEIWNKLSGLTL